jgi:hypothetical protein
MGQFKIALIFNRGEILQTAKGITTDWTYLEDLEKNSKTGKRYIKARCKCGRECRIALNNVRSGTSTSCGYSPCRGEEREKDIEVGYRAILYVYKKHAKARGFSFNLDYDYFKQLTQQSCYYCGIEPKQIYQLKNPKTGKIRSGVPIVYNGIDRVNSTKDYTSDNVVSCCKTCNTAKSNLPLNEFKDWINRIYLETIKKNKDGSPNSTC